MENRFLIIEKELDGTSHMKVVGEAAVSNRIDMADCYDNPYEVFYLTDEGKLAPVTGKNFTRSVDEDDENIVHASSELWADGKRVGYVYHTDH